MKIKKLFGCIEIHWSFKLWRIKILKISIPDNADDCHCAQRNKKDHVLSEREKTHHRFA